MVKRTTYNGTAGDDLLVINDVVPISQKINGLGGNDWILGYGGADILTGGPGADTIYMFPGDTVNADGMDHLILGNVVQNVGSTVQVHGATASTVFDFSDVGNHMGVVGDDPWPAYWTHSLGREALTFDRHGNLHIDTVSNFSGAVHDTIIGTPFHNASALDAAISNGTVLLDTIVTGKWDNPV